ncbi:hypothetical protein [Streptomyces sp. NBC_01719]|uniref:hypothetical protein n=2 Tax=unclassified Streptomyces TaxID=2593676 RepID=UPI0022532079|nr:hypothetical protein [Streptomyces sp. NBC_01719]MCX4462373.1 hypothetical protein [Streptomyces sp. NBC_01719]
MDACLTLRNAYGQLGVRAELLAVDLAVQDKGGGGTRYGSLTPSWTGTSWNGHCVLVLPDSERFVDATVEQFDEIREVGAGPMIGKVALSTHDDGSMMEQGGQVMLQRGDLVLTYTIAGPDAVASIVEHPEAVAHADGHHRTGVNVASFTLVALRGAGVRGRAMQGANRNTAGTGNRSKCGHLIFVRDPVSAGRRSHYRGKYAVYRDRTTRRHRPLTWGSLPQRHVSTVLRLAPFKAVLFVLAVFAIGGGAATAATTSGSSSVELPKPKSTVVYPIRFQEQDTKPASRPIPTVSYPIPWDRSQ